MPVPDTQIIFHRHVISWVHENWIEDLDYIARQAGKNTCLLKMGDPLVEVADLQVVRDTLHLKIDDHLDVIDPQVTRDTLHVKMKDRHFDNQDTTEVAVVNLRIFDVIKILELQSLSEIS